MRLRNSIASAVANARTHIRLRIAVLWLRVYRVQNHATRIWQRYRSTLPSAILLLLAAASAYLSPSLQTFLAKHYTANEDVERLRDLLLNTGSALIGAAAIVSSLVLFAMQINVERMPYGLFRRLSADSKLLGAFLISFVLAIGVAALSTFMEQIGLAYSVLWAAWSVVLILFLFKRAYSRALFLINPLNQLNIICQDSRRALRLWAKRAQRASRRLKAQQTVPTSPSPTDGLPDTVRTVYFQLDSRGTDEARKAVQHAMSFARRFAEQGDYEISGAALNTILRVNAAYIEAKGDTFYANHLVLHDSRSSDAFINESLEFMRQNVQVGITRRDERLIEQTFRSIAALAQVYLSINYGSLHAEKSHANLAAGYLTSAVQAVVPHDMIDVLLEGQRLMGRTAEHFLRHGTAVDLVLLSDNLAKVACTGCAKDDYHPLTSEGMTQLANLTFYVLAGTYPNVHFLLDRFSQDVTRVATSVLRVIDTHPPGTHRACLEPYFSITGADCLRVRLKNLVNYLCDLPADHDHARMVMRNVGQWADGLYHMTKHVFFEAVTARSYSTLEMIQWITDVTDILLAASNVPACRPDEQAKLRTHAHRLIATFALGP